MPSVMVHSTIDLLAFGRHHFDLHQEKDAPSATLGFRHRSVHHEWYKAFSVEWDFDEPFPASLHSTIEHLADAQDDEEAERSMSFAAHDYFDRVWDSLSRAHRDYVEGFCIWILSQPDVLKEKFGVDVLNERIARKSGPDHVWDEAPGLRREYMRLRAYGKAVLEKKPVLQRALDQFGNDE